MGLFCKGERVIIVVCSLVTGDCGYFYYLICVNIKFSCETVV